MCLYSGSRNLTHGSNTLSRLDRDEAEIGLLNLSWFTAPGTDVDRTLTFVGRVDEITLPSSAFSSPVRSWEGVKTSRTSPASVAGRQLDWCSKNQAASRSENVTKLRTLRETCSHATIRWRGRGPWCKI